MTEESSDAKKEPKGPRILRAGEIRPVVHSANYFTIGGEHRGPGTRRINNIELLFVVHGRLNFETEGKAYTINGGEILFIEPLHEHTLLRDLSGGDMTVGYIHHELLPDASWRENDYRTRRQPQTVTRVGSDTVFNELFRRAAQMFKEYGRLRDHILEGIVREIWLRLIRIWREPDSRQASQRTQAMVDYLRRNLKTTNGRQDLAREFYLSPEYVTALFKKELEITPSEFILRERVLLGQRLIQEQGMTVKEAADETGFYDQYYFSRAFKRFLGFTPSQLKWGKNE